MSGWPGAATLIVLAMTALVRAEAPISLALPTDNKALLSGNNDAFYQVIERNLHGEISHPWQGGQYGFVRDPVETAAGTVYTRFHEGMDIRPVHRDARGEPLDEVRAMADGKVVYTNPSAGASNYGRYVVVEHRWGGCPYYSLYAHLNTIAVAEEEAVKQGDKLAIMGHTGAGIDRERAHVHVELNLFLNDQFEAWHEAVFPGERNHNGVYNGINLAGLDLPRFLIALRENPSLTIPAFLGRSEPFYKVLLPASPHFELARRYPWMVEGSPDDKPASWEVSFDRSGLPLRIKPSDRVVHAAEVSYVKPGPVDLRYLTRHLAGRGSGAHLTESGRAYMRLLTFPD
ncbi:MAG TPA: M23 family metallopeptidase [Chthoniobacterales bacterium]